MPGFLSNGSIALTVFKIENPAAVTGDKLRKYAFRSIDDLSSETKAHGWTSIEDMLDVNWQCSAPEKGHFLCFALRVDTRKVPQPVLKKHLAEALREETEKNSAEGKTYISRARKKELKELYTARLLAKTDPVPVTVDMAFDTQSGLLYVGSTTTAHQKLMAELFTQSFGQEPQPVLSTVDVPHILQELYAASRDITFDGHTYSLAEAGQLTLAAGDGEVSVKNEPTSAQSGMEAGLSICKLKLQMTRVGETDLEWQFTLNLDLSFSGLKTPKIEKRPDDDADAALLAKLYLLEQTVGVIHTLFEVRS